MSKPNRKVFRPDGTLEAVYYETALYDWHRLDGPAVIFFLKDGKGVASQMWVIHGIITASVFLPK